MKLQCEVHKIPSHCLSYLQPHLVKATDEKALIWGDYTNDAYMLYIMLPSWCFCQKTKHVDVDRHFIREYILSGDITTPLALSYNDQLWMSSSIPQEVVLNKLIIC